MIDRWYISDTHFNHENVIKFCPDERFKTIQDRNELIIENWNKVVKHNDIIYHLGDVYFGSLEDYRVIHKRLNGVKRLIIGNHDNIGVIVKANLFSRIKYWTKAPDNLPILFSHDPKHEKVVLGRFPLADKVMNVHGHEHTEGSPSPMHRSVCVEMNNYTPVNYDQIVEEFNNL